MKKARFSDRALVYSVKITRFPDRSMRQLLQDPAYVRYVVGLVFPEVLELLDFSRGVQLNRTSLSPTLEEREADVVVRVPFRDPAAGAPVHICILIEHQSRSEWLMYLRMLIYMVRIWEAEYRQFGSKPRGEQEWSPILPIVFYTGESRWTAPVPLTEALNIPRFLERFVPKFETLFLDVKQMESERLTQAGHPFGWVLRVLQEEHSDESAFRDALETAAREIGRLGGMRDTQLREALHYLILLILHRRSAEERDAFINIVKENSQDERGVTTMAQTAAESLIQQGARQMSVESTLTVLTGRFPGADVSLVKSRLEAIEDLTRLKELTLNASMARSFRAFREELEA